MSSQKCSLFSVICRSLFGGFFAFIGFFLAGFLLIFVVVAATTTQNKVEKPFEQEATILPDAENQREFLAGNDVPVILQMNFSGLVGFKNLSYHTILNQLISSQEEGLFKKGRVKGILIVMDSPGGEAVASTMIYQALKQYRETYKIPIYVYVERYCASGAFLAACATNAIYGHPLSITGSVGTFYQTMNFSGTLEKCGVEPKAIFAGKNKDEMNPLRPWKEGEFTKIQEITDYYYQDFVSIVATSRPKLTKTALVEDYGANVFTAPEALKYGFIDEIIPDRNSALKRLCEAAKIGDQPYQVYQLHEKVQFSDFLMRSSSFLSESLADKISFDGKKFLELNNKILFLDPSGLSRYYESN